MMLLEDIALMLYDAGSRRGVENRYLKFILSAGTYSVDDFNAKANAAILEQKEAPQIKNLKLVIP